MSAASQPLTRTPMTPLERRAADLLAHGGITYRVACPDKRFARSLGGMKQLTDAQRDYLWRMVHRYRRQIGEDSCGLLKFAADDVARQKRAAEPARARVIYVEAELAPGTNVSEILSPLLFSEVPA